MAPYTLDFGEVEDRDGVRPKIAWAALQWKHFLAPGCWLSYIHFFLKKILLNPKIRPIEFAKAELLTVRCRHSLSQKSKRQSILHEIHSYKWEMWSYDMTAHCATVWPLTHSPYRSSHLPETIDILGFVTPSSYFRLTSPLLPVADY